MKRMYVRPKYRGQGLGRALANKVIDDARQIGYSRMILETLPYLKVAHELYRSLGFRDIQAYTNNPNEGVKSFGLDL